MDNNRSIYIAILFIIAMFFFIADVLYFNYDFIYEMGLSNSWLEKRLSRLTNTFMFRSSYITRGFVLLLTTISILLSKVKSLIEQLL